VISPLRRREGRISHTRYTDNPIDCDLFPSQAPRPLILIARPISLFSWCFRLGNLTTPTQQWTLLIRLPRRSNLIPHNQRVNKSNYKGPTVRLLASWLSESTSCVQRQWHLPDQRPLIFVRSPKHQRNHHGRSKCRICKLHNLTSNKNTDESAAESEHFNRDAKHDSEVKEDNGQENSVGIISPLFNLQVKVATYT
jgi:hypothetical protein